jgi:AraC family transcriptional regulator, regulatory protein of adaptative response / DNA-3-methyladenine glycosylase II
MRHARQNDRVEVPLPYSGPLDWRGMLSYFAARAIPGVEQVADGVYRRTIEAGAVELLPGGNDHLVLRATGAAPEQAMQRARRMMSLDLDLEEASRHLAGDPIVGQLVKARPGLRVPGAWDPFEIGVRAIVGQQVTVAGANTLMGRLVSRFGPPTPAVLSGADLAGLGLTGARADAIRSFARAVADGTVRLDRSVHLDEFVDSVVAIDGLGAWTAQYIALRLGEPDAFPAADLGLRRAVAGRARDPETNVADLAERWRPWRALAATHLWVGGRLPPA